jgi:hypothetical protein
VNEDFLVSAISYDKSEAFRLIEKFYCTGFHCNNCLLLLFIDFFLLIAKCLQGKLAGAIADVITL